MMDLRLYSSENSESDSETLVQATPSDKTAFGIEVLANKVIKFLLTQYGSDLFEPEYGGNSMHHAQISKNYLPKFRIELIDDIDRCKRYIASSESTLPDTDTTLTESLDTIEINSVSYNQKTNSVHVYITIYSTTGKKAVVAVNSRTDS